MSFDGNFIYHISIIDYLQKYTFNKKCERYFKMAFSGATGNELSSTNINHYHNRFLGFMKEKVFNYEFNHQVDMIKLNRKLEQNGLIEVEPNPMVRLESMSDLSIFGVQ